MPIVWDKQTSFISKREESVFREAELLQIKAIVMALRLEMPGIGTRTLYYLLSQELPLYNIKMGSDALFNYLQRKRIMIKP